MSGWIFAAGHNAETALTPALDAGDNAFTHTGIGAIFSLGDFLFISPSPGSGGAPASSVQWLGRVTQLTANQLSFSLPLRDAVAAGAHLWRAPSWINLEPA